MHCCDLTIGYSGVSFSHFDQYFHSKEFPTNSTWKPCQDLPMIEQKKRWKAFSSLISEPGQLLSPQKRIVTPALKSLQLLPTKWSWMRILGETECPGVGVQGSKQLISLSCCLALKCASQQSIIEIAFIGDWGFICICCLPGLLQLPMPRISWDGLGP